MAISLCVAAPAPASQLELVSTGVPANGNILVHGSQVVIQYFVFGPVIEPRILHYDAATGELIQIAAMGIERFAEVERFGDVAIGDRRIAFLASEGFSGKDLNGDSVMHTFDPQSRTARNLGLAVADFSWND